MNKIFFAVSCILSATLFSCSKNDGPAPVETYKYLTLTSGSSWMYEITNNNAPGGISTNTMVSTNRDSVIYNRSYHVFTNSLDNSSEYYAIEGKEYYNFILLPIGANQTRRVNLYFAVDHPHLRHPHVLKHRHPRHLQPKDQSSKLQLGASKHACPI